MTRYPVTSAALVKPENKRVPLMFLSLVESKRRVTSGLEAMKVPHLGCLLPSPGTRFAKHKNTKAPGRKDHRIMQSFGKHGKTCNLPVPRTDGRRNKLAACRTSPISP